MAVRKSAGPTCPSGKKRYPTMAMAEDALIDLWSLNEYHSSSAPIAVYKCEDCPDYHFTSRPPMNEKLSEAIASGKIKKGREAYYWESKFKRRH